MLATATLHWRRAEIALTHLQCCGFSYLIAKLSYFRLFLATVLVSSSSWFYFLPNTIYQCFCYFVGYFLNFFQTYYIYYTYCVNVIVESSICFIYARLATMGATIQPLNQQQQRAHTLLHLQTPPPTPSPPSQYPNPLRNPGWKYSHTTTPPSPPDFRNPTPSHTISLPIRHHHLTSLSLRQVQGIFCVPARCAGIFEWGWGGGWCNLGASGLAG